MKLKYIDGAELTPKEMQIFLESLDQFLKDRNIERVSNYDAKGNAAHYKKNRLDTLTIFERVYGTEATMTFCEINAMKYRLRAGYKDDLDQEIIKAKWYETKAAELFKKLGCCGLTVAVAPTDNIVYDNTVKTESNV